MAEPYLRSERPSADALDVATTHTARRIERDGADVACRGKSFETWPAPDASPLLVVVLTVRLVSAPLLLVR